MSNERERSGADTRVSDVYRELADERTPRHLDDRVLRMAAREGRTRYSLVRAWMRPVAWAATIGLSLAIVMELTLFSGIEQEYAEPAAVPAAPEPGTPEAARPMPAEPEPASPAGLRQDTPPAATEKGEREEVPGPAESRPVAKRSRAADASAGSVEELVPQAVSIVREAEELARIQAGPDQLEAASDEIGDATHEDAPSAESTAAFAASAVRAEGRAPVGCPSRDRESADTWYACIERLREQGLDELADLEFEAFSEAHPDHENAAKHR